MENEVQAYLAEFNTLRAEIRKALQGLGYDGANWQPLSKDSNSIYALITHLTGAQSNWMKRVIAGIPIQRDREAEFKASGSLPEALKAWEAIDREADGIMAKLALKQLDETREASGPYGRVTVRWCILHQISHYATHLGHIQITRQLWDQQHA